MAANGRYHTIAALVEDKPGVLTRVASLFRRRGFNIASLAVGKSELAGLSRMTFVVDGDQYTVDQATKQLDKLIDVIQGFGPGGGVERRQCRRCGLVQTQHT